MNWRTPLPSESKNQWFVAVTAGRWQRIGIIEAKKLGYKVVGIDTNSAADGLKYCDHVISEPLNEQVLIISLLEKLDGEISGVASICSEVGMPLAAAIREHFSLPGPSIEITNRLLDKGLQRKFWQEKKVAGPSWNLCSSVNETLEKIQSMSFPLIIKPIDSSGSRGVARIDRDTEDLRKVVENAFSFSKGSQVIIEDFMEGIEYAIESLVVDGVVNVLAISEKKKVPGSNDTVASEYRYPSCSAETLDKMKELVSKAYQAIGYENGPGHAELILKEDGSLGMIEVAGRGGGFTVFEIYVPFICDVNLPELTVKQALGLSVDTSHLASVQQTPAILRFFPSSNGQIVSFDGFQDFADHPGIISEAFVSVGDSVGNAKADADRLGFLLTKSPRIEEAESLAEQVEKRVNFVIKECDE